MVIKKCFQCEIEFKGRKESKYCSMECSQESQKGVSKLSNLASNNGMWKGDKVGYAGLHIWLSNNKPKASLCEICKDIPPKDLANLNKHQYTRNLQDYVWLCRSCHNSIDRDITYTSHICKMCNKGFKIKLANGRNPQYCSKNCSDKGLRRKNEKKQKEDC